MKKKNTKILLVDDEKDILEIVGYNLSQEGYQIFTAANGKEAIAKAKKEIPDLIIMDVMMPEMDGLEATRKIRQLVRKDVKTMPIVAMTANAFAEDVNRSIESGMNAHMSKPFEKKDMVQILIRYMNK